MARASGEAQGRPGEARCRARPQEARLLAAPIKIAVEGFRRHLGKQRILDPACGSGNFLYVALRELLDLEDQVVRFAAVHDISVPATPHVRPAQLHGIEINPYAAELAQVVIWIGYLQWLHDRGIDPPNRPILDKLQNVEQRDAILDLSDKKNPAPAKWPEADYIIGNPPFLGSKLFRQHGVSDDYLRDLWRAYDLPRASDLCCYWHERAHKEVDESGTARVGLLATQGIRGGDNREVLKRITQDSRIFEAWSDHEWTLEGAAVRVSIVCFAKAPADQRHLNGITVPGINSDLTSGSDLTAATLLAEMEGLAFQGTVKVGAFDVDFETTRNLLGAPTGPGGGRNSEVLKPWYNGFAITRRYDGTWIIDFEQRDLEEASRYEEPFLVVQKRVKSERERNNDRQRRTYWWRLGRSGEDVRKAVGPLTRYIGTPRLAKHRVFVWLDPHVLPDCQVVAIARSDDFAFGCLHSALHVLWALRTGTQLEDRPRYTSKTTFETFPLPWPAGKEDTSHPAYRRISESAKELNELRERWLNPPEWIDPLAARIDAADDFADVPADARPLIRQSAIMAAAAKDPRLKKRTLTNLYNERPQWLKLAHEKLDRAVLAAYAATDPQGDWSEDWAKVWTDTGAGQPLPETHPLAAERRRVDQFVLQNLLRLNSTRADI